MSGSFSVSARSSAPIERVWPLLADATRWPSWAPMVRTMRYEREGDVERDGVGAVRFFGLGPIGSREEVTAFEPPQRLAYRMVRGLPVRGYESEVQLTATDDGGTTITWSSSWERARPARFWHAWLRSTMQRFAHRLASGAETLSDAGAPAPRRL